MVIYKKATVVNWHKIAFKLFWTKKCKKIGRPPISKDIILKIKQLRIENPMMSAEKIFEMLLSLNIIDAPSANSVRKYIPTFKKTPTDLQRRSFSTYLKTHSRDIWAMDYFVVPTLTFKLIYVLVVINHGSQKIEHFAVTTNPNMEWVKQQIRNATPIDHKPKYLIHDNDSVFTSNHFQSFLKNIGIKSKRTAYRSPWQNGIAERVNGIIRQELTNHTIPINEKHLYFILADYVNNYYNPHRTHQSINCKTSIPMPDYKPTKLLETYFKRNKVLSGMYSTYTKTA